MANFRIIFGFSAVIFFVLMTSRETSALPAGNSAVDDNLDGPIRNPPPVANGTRSILPTQSNDYCWLNDPARNEKIVHDFFKRVYEGQELYLLNYYFDENVEVINTDIKSRNALKEELQKSFSEGLRATVDIKSTRSETQSVWSHVHVTTFDAANHNFVFVAGYVLQFYFHCYGQVVTIYAQETGFVESVNN